MRTFVTLLNLTDLLRSVIFSRLPSLSAASLIRHFFSEFKISNRVYLPTKCVITPRSTKHYFSCAIKFFTKEKHNDQLLTLRWSLSPVSLNKTSGCTVSSLSNFGLVGSLIQRAINGIDTESNMSHLYLKSSQIS